VLEPSGVKVAHAHERPIRSCDKCKRFMWQRGGEEDEQKCHTCRCNAKIQAGLAEVKDGVESSSLHREMVQLRTLQHAIVADDKIDFEKAEDERLRRAAKLESLKEARADPASLLSEKEALAQVYKITHLNCCICLLEMHIQGGQCFEVTRCLGVGIHDFVFRLRVDRGATRGRARTRLGC
jgi:hypothetical protein